MDIDEFNAKLSGFNDSLCHGIGYIVILEVEKDLGIFYIDKVDYLWPAVGKELFADFEHPHMVLELCDEFLRFLEMFNVKGKDDFFFWLHKSSFE
jgi:hypothetical protein